MVPRHTLIFQAHPDRESFCAALADRYAKGARARGHSVDLITLVEVAFDPILKHNYHKPHPLEPSLEEIQARVLRADHLVFVFPVWWGSVPALMKGFLDRTFVPGFAFEPKKKGSRFKKLLTGKSAHLMVTMGAPSWAIRILHRDSSINSIRYGFCSFCGIGPVRVTRFSGMDTAAPETLERYLTKAETAGERLR